MTEPNTISVTITAVIVILCLTILGVLLYSLIAENPQVEDVSFGLVIIAIVIGVIAALTAETINNRYTKENSAMSVQPDEHPGNLKLASIAPDLCNGGYEAESAAHTLHVAAQYIKEEA